MCTSVCMDTALTCSLHSIQITHVCAFSKENQVSQSGAAAGLLSAFVVSRCSDHPQVLLVYHSDGGRGPPLSETLLFCPVVAQRSPPRWSPCRCQLTAGLYAAGHRWWLTCNTTEENVSCADRYVNYSCYREHIITVNTKK